MPDTTDPDTTAAPGTEIAEPAAAELPPEVFHLIYIGRRQAVGVTTTRHWYMHVADDDNPLADAVGSDWGCLKTGLLPGHKPGAVLRVMGPAGNRSRLYGYSAGSSTRPVLVGSHPDEQLVARWQLEDAAATIAADTLRREQRAIREQPTPLDDRIAELRALIDRASPAHRPAAIAHVISRLLR